MLTIYMPTDYVYSGDFEDVNLLTKLKYFSKLIVFSYTLLAVFESFQQ
jgi:hypothetical protein